MSLTEKQKLAMKAGRQRAKLVRDGLLCRMCDTPTAETLDKDNFRRSRCTKCGAVCKTRAK